MIEENIHKALSSPTRREIILSLGEGKKYLSEIAEVVDRAPQTVDFHLSILEKNNLIGIEVEKGKKFYCLKDRKILQFLRERRPLHPRHHPKPPHEIILDVRDELNKRMGVIEGKLDEILKKLK